MLRTVAWSAGCAVIPAAVLAATDIPTRYSGSSPSFGPHSKVTGTFTGGSLTLTTRFSGGALSGPRSGRFACRQASPTQTRCAGALRSNDGQLGARGVLTITWKTGRPVAVAFNH
jgi:hypothetical protein